MDKFLIKIYGKVQGIGYRWFIYEKAIKYNLSGWVKNNPDGSVECAVKGIKDDIEKFIFEIKNEHPCAVVKNIEISDCPTNIYIPENFEILK
ncbi:MAG: acylphosphatase [Elusimicrobiales bacterium]|nr:acylphosphatase [Elusimicrobiales bacterium]